MEDAHRDARAKALAAKEVKAKAVAALHERQFPVEDNGSLEWVNVIPRNYGAVGKDSWELVEVRTPDDGPAAVLSSESDGDSEMKAET